jgi:hypothetical protein
MLLNKNIMSNLPQTNTVTMGWEETREKNQRLMLLGKSVMDFISGLVIIGAGILFVAKDHFGVEKIKEIDDDHLLIPLFGGVCIIYGLWRFYRGYLKLKAR